MSQSIALKRRGHDGVQFPEPLGFEEQVTVAILKPTLRHSVPLKPADEIGHNPRPKCRKTLKDAKAVKVDLQRIQESLYSLVLPLCWIC